MTANEEMKGKDKIPENPKVKTHRVNKLNEYLTEIKDHYNTLKNQYQSNLEDIEKFKKKNEYLNKQIGKLRTRKDELLEEIERLNALVLDYDELGELKSKKAQLEKDIAQLRQDKKEIDNATEKAAELLESMEVEEL